MDLDELTALMAAPIYAASCARFLPQDKAQRKQLIQDAVRDARAIWLTVCEHDHT